MKIVKALPPNFQAIKAVFPMAIKPTVIFAYGDIIYNPSGKAIPPEIIAHEEVHGKRQLEMGVELWWERYLTDKQFRYDEELLAHREEYKQHCKLYTSRAHRRSGLILIARRLCSPLYGSVVNMEKAKLDLTKE